MKKLIAIGLGPGEAELITVKGLEKLKQAEVIFYPATEVTEKKVQSYSLEILKQYPLKGRLIPLFIPMKLKEQHDLYREVYEQIRLHLETEKNVAIVNEGDLLFYSTFGYILPFLKQAGIQVEIIPGIPAFIDAASKSKSALIEKNQNLAIVPRPGSFYEVKEALKRNNTIVVMKMCVLDQWYRFIVNNNYRFFYGEKLGTVDEFYTTDLNELKTRIFPYFSLIILYKQTNNENI